MRYYPGQLYTMPNGDIVSTQRLRIFMDGCEQKMVLMFSIDEGLIERAILTDDGKMQADPNCDDRMWTETVRGSVAVEIRP